MKDGDKGKSESRGESKRERESERERETQTSTASRKDMDEGESLDQRTLKRLSEKGLGWKRRERESSEHRAYEERGTIARAHGHV